MRTVPNTAYVNYTPEFSCSSIESKESSNVPIIHMSLLSRTSISSPYITDCISRYSFSPGFTERSINVDIRLYFDNHLAPICG